MFVPKEMVDGRDHRVCLNGGWYIVGLHSTHEMGAGLAIRPAEEDQSGGWVPPLADMLIASRRLSPPWGWTAFRMLEPGCVDVKVTAGGQMRMFQLLVVPWDLFPDAAPRDR